MRIDKFLKTSRLIKRRVIAKDVTDKQMIMINNKIAKPSSTLKIGDTITLNFAKGEIKVLVKSFNPKEIMIEEIK